MAKDKEAPEAVEFTYVTNGGRDIWWKPDGNGFQIHNGDESKAVTVADWAPVQAFLDGKAGNPVR